MRFRFDLIDKKVVNYCVHTYSIHNIVHTPYVSPTVLMNKISKVGPDANEKWVFHMSTMLETAKMVLPGHQLP
jgi:hypothetical protein